MSFWKQKVYRMQGDAHSETSASFIPENKNVSAGLFKGLQCLALQTVGGVVGGFVGGTHE